MSKKENRTEAVEQEAVKKEKSVYYLHIGVLVALFCVTLGFWWFYFIARTTRILNDDLSRDKRSVKKEVLKSFIPLYIPLEWADRSAERLDNICNHIDRKSNLKKHSLLLALCPLAYCIVVQCRINKIEKEYFLFSI